MLEYLVCPVTHAPLTYDAERQELVSRAVHLAFPIRGGIPILLTDEADALERAERIRRYVAAVRARMPEPQECAGAATLGRWTSWALAVADEIDPVANGLFTSNAALHEQ